MLPFNTEDFSILERETGLPGLRLVLDPVQLQEHVNSSPLFATVSGFSLDYVRYKPGMNCLGRYRITSELGRTWAYAKAFSDYSRLKLEKVGQRLEEGGAAESGLVLPEPGVFFSVFPFDFKLRSIGRLAQQQTRDRLFRRLFDDPDRWPGSSGTILNYKPERRLVMQLTASDGARSTVKCYTAREYERLAGIRKTLKHLPDVLTPRQIGQSRKHRCLAFEWIEGETLRSRSLGNDISAREHRQAGEMIARFHRAAVRKGMKTLWPPMSASAPTLHSLARQLAFLLPDVESDALSLANMLEVLDLDRNSGRNLIHGDFYDKQIILTDDAPGLIDLDCARLGDIHQDLACFLAHRERHALSGQVPDGEMGSRLSGAFLEGYRQAGGEYCDRQLAHWVAWHLLKLSHHPFRDRTPGWPQQTRAMVARALALLQAETTKKTAMV